MLSLATITSCEKKDDDSAQGVPVQMTLTGVPRPDGSGNVDFAASATDAVTYEYNFGNGIYQNVASGTVTYKYPAAGNYTITATAKNAAGQTTTKSIQVSVTLTATGALLWSEEFDNNGAPDPTKWGYDLGAGGWGNLELENYTNRPENSIVSGGTLKINAIREAYNGSPFTSARLLTKNKFSFTYGRVEVRAKLPTGVGTWPAIWMLGSDVDTNPWPACGEIDIMEHLGREQNKIYGTLHYPNHSGAGANGATTTVTDATEYHVYALDWTAESVKISVDGVVFHTVPNSTSIPFNHDFFIILNVAMGGNFAGPVDAAVNGGTMEVDYVRVYRN